MNRPVPAAPAESPVPTGSPQPAAAEPAPAAGRWRLRHLPAPLAVTAALVVAAAIVGGLLRGGVGAVGGAAGVAVVGLAFLASTAVLAWADSVAPALVFPFGMMAYLVKITVIGGGMSVAAAVGWGGLVPMAWGVAAGVVGWTGAHLWWLARNPPCTP